MIEISIGQRVRIGEHGVSVFEVREIEDETHVLIESVEENSPGRYPFSMPTSALHPVERSRSADGPKGAWPPGNGETPVICLTPKWQVGIVPGFLSASIRDAGTVDGLDSGLATGP